MRFWALLWLGIVSWPAAASATVYRCVGEAGEPEFRQHPCGATAVMRTAVEKPPVATGVRPSERAWLKTRERAKTGKTKKRTTASDAGRADKARKQAYRCTRKQRALDAVNAELRRGYKPAKGDSLRRRQRGYRDYLDAFCS